ncbi:MAG: hypothetical protein JWM20_359 [Patescibacteria group bacterium]|nr:hypothetical protein [Patescibacteria group bacterium]
MSEATQGKLIKGFLIISVIIILSVSTAVGMGIIPAAAN